MNNYLVVNVVDGLLGVIHERKTFVDAVKIAAEMAAEQCDVSVEDAIVELTKDGDFMSPNGDVHITIAQAEPE